jgi:biopolymer transport protein ExbD
MNIRKRRAFHDEDAMAAMNDIMFFLMLFFLIISTMANPNVIKLMLPQSSNSDTMSKQPLTLTVDQVNDNLTYFLNKEPIQEADLEAALTGATTRNEDKTVVLRMAKTLTIQDLVNVMDIGAKLKLKLIMSTVK